MPAAQTRRVRPPTAAPPEAVVAAIRDTAMGRAGVAAVYLFEQPDERGTWGLTVGVQLAPGAVAASVMPAVAADLRECSGVPLRLLALSRRMLAAVRLSVPSLPPAESR